MFLASSLVACWQNVAAAGFEQQYVDSQNSGIFLWIALAIGAIGLVIALLFARNVLKSDNGTPEMQSISNAIREGAEAFMGRQYTSIAIIAAVLAVVLYIGYRLSPFTAPMANKVVISFLIGAICSALSGYTGMFVSIAPTFGLLRQHARALDGLCRLRCAAALLLAWW
jgi:K(+)-stimulated pyrophosphate-energized sodium pump